jgi:branched-chain amino acid transport system ATP-binding protein
MLRVDDLHVAYGVVPVIKGVSFTVGDGEIVTILGSNGAGKTTLLRAISGLVPVTRGSIRFDARGEARAGDDIAGIGAHRVMARGLCLVPEGRQLFPDQTVHENLELGAFQRLRAGGKKSVAEDLERMFVLFPKIRERLEQKAGLLSGGEQQMVAIARALLGRPRLLMLDEPSLGLAPVLARQIFDSFATLREQGLSLLIVEQRAWLGLGICDRAYVLESGRFTIAGPRDEIMRNPEVIDAYLGRVAAGGAHAEPARPSP